MEEVDVGDFQRQLRDYSLVAVKEGCCWTGEILIKFKPSSATTHINFDT